MTHPGYENDEFWEQATRIPNEFKIALADLVISFGRLELAIDQLVWWAAGIKSAQIGKALTARLDIRPKCEIALKILAELEDSTALSQFEAIEKNIQLATRRRNAVVHGWWIAIGDSAVAMSTRGKMGDEGALVTGEFFKVEDIEHDSKLAKEAERSIHALISQPAPPPRLHSH